MDRTTTHEQVEPAHDENCFLAAGGGGLCNCSLSKEPEAPAGAESIKGACTLDEIIAGFKERVALAMAEALKETYSQFVNDCDLWARSDIECNTASHAREAIRAMLAGEDPAYVVHSIKSYGFRQADAIRDLILARHADPLVKKALEEKDKEIARLKDLLSSWSRR